MDAFIGSIILWPATFVPLGWFLCAGQLLKITEYQALYSLLGPRFGGDGVSSFALPDLRNRVPFGTYSPDQSPTPYGAVSGAAGELNAAGSVTMTTVPPHTHTAVAGQLVGSASGNVSVPFKSSVTVNSSGSVNLSSTDIASGNKTPAANDILVAAGGAAANIYAAPGTAKVFPLGSNSAVQTSGTGMVSGTASGPASLPVTIPAGSQIAVQPNQGSTTQAMSLPIPGLPLNYIICWQGIYPSRN